MNLREHPCPQIVEQSQNPSYCIFRRLSSQTQAESLAADLPLESVQPKRQETLRCRSNRRHW